MVINKKTEGYIRIGVGIIAIAFLAFNILLIFNNSFWCDEIASIVMAKMPLKEMIIKTSQDVHPPLYYAILRICCLIFGFNGPVYHMVSILGYMGILVVSLTLIWDNAGYISSIVLIALSSLLYSAVHFNVEVRMYSWAAFFILLSFMFYKKILQGNGSNRKDYLLFALFSILAAYTHYFCIITVGIFYVSIMIIGIKKKGNYLKNSILTWIITVIVYLPWAISFLINYSGNTDKIYSARYNSIWPCILYIFSSKFSILLLAVFVLLFFGICIKKHKDDDFIWICTGILSVLTTILVPYIISMIMSPIMEERHVYPSFVIIWLLMGYCISKLKHKYVYLAIVLILVVPFGISGLKYSFEEEKAQDEALNRFLEETSFLADSNTSIISDEWQVAIPLMDYYYGRQADYVQNEEEMYKLIADEKESYLLVTKTEKDDIENGLKKLGYLYEPVVKDGFLGSLRLDVYRCTEASGDV